MIQYESFVLSNGLRVIVHEDRHVPTAVLNILYDVGSKDENENKTGFAHLFEHLMFGGSKHISDYDQALQRVGGENNAFTSPDITNYYITVPAQNLETAFWLESDRMLSLSFDPVVLETQQKVVIEEFKQRYLNQPYGDVWLKLRPLAYEKHPYQWATIGKDISHIENATLDDVREFFGNYYLPNNAIMVVAGNVKTAEIERLARKWFEPIPAGKRPVRNLPKEPKQENARFTEIKAKVPVDALYKAFHMVAHSSPEYYATDLLNDILGRSRSSRLYQRLVKEQNLLSTVNAYVTGSMDEGLFVVTGRPQDGVSLEQADAEITKVLQELVQEKVKESELEKVKNQAESGLVFSEIELLNRAMNLAYATVLGDPNLINQESEKIQAVTSDKILAAAQNVLRSENCSTLYYRAEKE